MVRLHLLAIVALLGAIAPSHQQPPIKPAEVDVSHETAWKAQSHFIQGDQCDSDGDIMAITYCYCGEPDYSNLTSQWPEAHYVEVNYFNVHLNVSFNLNETCISTNRGECLGHKWEWVDPDKLDISRHDGTETAQDVWGLGYREIQWNGMCAYWSKEKQNHNGYWQNFSPQPHGGYGNQEPSYKDEVDKFCFWPNPGMYYEYMDDKGKPDRTFYNGQRRWLRDGQGFIDFQGQKVRDTCDDLCVDHTGLPQMLWTENEVNSHQHCASKLDDMCQHCA